MKRFLPDNGNSGRTSENDLVYVNQSLDLRHIGAFGLDLDHTLAVYDDAAVNGLAFGETCRNLVEEKHYPPSFLNFSYIHSGVIRGLVPNVQTGDLLKLDHDNRVIRACHGLDFLDTRTISSKYGSGAVILPPGGYAGVQSPFDLPTASLFALSVNFFDKTSRHRPDYGTILGDIREMLDKSHTRGELKRRILADLPRFIETRPGLSRALIELKSAGKKTFLLTNSGPDYTADLLGHILDTSFGSLFDAVVVHARKPDFFRADSSEIAPFGDDPRIADRGLLRFDSAPDLEQYLGVSGSKIFFVGDNPFADCIASRLHGWRTGMVVPELESEPFPPGSPSAGNIPEPANIWGSVFEDAGLPTRFSRVIIENTDVFAAHIGNILARGPEHFFA